MWLITRFRLVNILFGLILFWNDILSNVDGQFNIRVGFQKEDVVTSSSYGNVGDPRRTTTLSPTIDYWPVSNSANRGFAFQQPNSPSGSHTFRQKKNSFKQWLINLNANNYDKYQMPRIDDHTPIEIIVSMMIIRVHSLSDASMDYGIDLYYREHWNDPRLRYNPFDYDGVDELNLPVIAVNHVWRPDTYFLNAISAEVDSENSVTHKAFFRLRYNGDIHYSRKISLKADCPMDLTMYPFDQQSCKLKLGSYSNPSREMIYKWVKKQGHDIEFKDRIDLAEFVADSYKTSSKKINYTTGSFDSLELCLTFKRRAGFCIMQVFFPATAVVMSSWVALWLAEDTTFSDVLAVILAIIFLAYAYNSVMPRVSYVKLLDLYMCSCFLFVFLSLAKLVIIKYFCHKWAKEGNKSSDFFLDQLLGMSANGQDVEQQASNGDLTTNKKSDSRRSSCISLTKDEKKKNGKLSPKKRSDSIKSIKSIKNEKGPFSSLLQDDRKRNGTSKNGDDESNENHKNEEIEATLAFADETTLSDESNQIESINPLAALFGETTVDKSADNINAANGAAGRRVTFLGLEAFSAWFDERKKKSGGVRYMKWLRYFHVITQLALPLAFGAFFIFLLLIYPNVPRSNAC